jgi:hypothetical protein
VDRVEKFDPTKFGASEVSNSSFDPSAFGAKEFSTESANTPISLGTNSNPTIDIGGETKSTTKFLFCKFPAKL